MSNSVNSNPFEKMAKLFANKELKRPTIDGLIDTASITEKEIETLFPQNQPANVNRFFGALVNTQNR